MAQEPAQPATPAEHIDLGLAGEQGVIVTSPATEATPSDVKAPAEPTSMLEAVQQALGEPTDPAVSETADGTKATETSPATPADGKAKSTNEDGEGEFDPTFLREDPTPEELGKYSRKANARIRDLVEQRNLANQQASEVAPILDFLHRNDIPKQDLDVILNLTAQLRHGNFAGFLEGVRPYVDLARQYTGQVLPPDLHQKVKDGYVSPEVARELAQRRADAQITQSRVQQDTRRSQQEVGQLRANAIRQSVGQWEDQIRARDPDYDLKADLVRRTAQALMQEHGVPQNPQQAIEYVNRAYSEVNEQAKRLRPAPKATAAVPSSTSSARGNSTPASEPNSLFEAAMKGLDAHRAGVNR
jgi:hypothetical protein